MMDERISELETALRLWKCRRCNGAKTVARHMCEDDDHDLCANYQYFPCEACYGHGIHRIASLALKLREKSSDELKDEEDAKRGIIRIHPWD